VSSATGMVTPGAPAATRPRVRWVLVTVGLLGALVLVALGVVALSTDDPAPRSDAPVEASVEDLRALAQRVDHPVYWAGSVPGKRFELTETRDGKVFIRYLPSGATVADRRPDFLTVATYPYRRAYAVTKASATRPGMVSRPAPAGGIAVWRASRPASVYLAFPGTDLLMEIFSPADGQSQRLVLDGEVGPIA